jgi:hypothetical protein
VLKGKKCCGGKFSKERLTVFLYGFMTGEKKKPLITENAAKPCFKNIYIKKLPVEWESKKKAGMT